MPPQQPLRALLRCLSRPWRPDSPATLTAGLPRAAAMAFLSSEAASGGHVAAIKQLRERTGAPMKDVKSALVACDWDMEAAFVDLRKKGMAAASKKRTRVASEGLLGIAQTDMHTAVVVEINSETDFVARNDIFQHLVHRVAAAALEIDALEESSAEGGGAISLSLPHLEAASVELSHPKAGGRRSVSEALAEVSALTGEHVRLRRAYRMAQPEGLVAAYLHGSPQPGLARIAGLVGLRVPGGSLAEGSSLALLAEQLAMQTVAARPLYLHRDAVPSAVIDHERDILTTQAAGSGKAKAMIERMVDGRLRKFYEDVVLLEQKFILDEGKRVQEVINELAKKEGAELSVSGMLRIEVGEGVEREEKNFKDEVEAQAAM